MIRRSTYGVPHIGAQNFAALGYAEAFVQSAVKTYAQVDTDAGTRRRGHSYWGFAAGLNRHIELHPAEFSDGFAPRFTGYDVLAKAVDVPWRKADIELHTIRRYHPGEPP